MYDAIVTGSNIVLPPDLQISKKYTHWAAVILFFSFGLRSLYDAVTGEVCSRCRAAPP